MAPGRPEPDAAGRARRAGTGCEGGGPRFRASAAGWDRPGASEARTDSERPGAVWLGGPCTRTLPPRLGATAPPPPTPPPPPSPPRHLLTLRPVPTGLGGRSSLWELELSRRAANPVLPRAERAWAPRYDSLLQAPGLLWEWGTDNWVMGGIRPGAPACRLPSEPVLQPWLLPDPFLDLESPSQICQGSRLWMTPSLSADPSCSTQFSQAYQLKSCCWTPARSSWAAPRAASILPSTAEAPSPTSSPSAQGGT